MASPKTLLIVAFAALVLLCGSVRAGPASETGVQHRAKRFSIAGIVECLAMIEFGGFPELITAIEEDCVPYGEQSFKFRLCVMGKIAHLGPEYLQCVMES